MNEPIVNPEIHREYRNPTAVHFWEKGETGTPPLGQGFRRAWLMTNQRFPWKILKSGSFILDKSYMSKNHESGYMRISGIYEKTNIKNLENPKIVC